VRPVAWWSDGEVAAIERATEDGCVRDVAMAVPDGSDLLLSGPAAGLLRALTAPCGGMTVPTAPLVADSLAMSGDTLAPALLFRPGATPQTGTDPWWLGVLLLALAGAALAAEWLLRRWEASS
jgi:hypothetical protein